MRRALLAAAALLLGLFAGILCHYLIYRLALPATPFIYVAF